MELGINLLLIETHWIDLFVVLWCSGLNISL